MNKLALLGVILFTISVPFQWLYLENNIVSAISTVLAIYIVLRYKKYLK